MKRINILKLLCIVFVILVNINVFCVPTYAEEYEFNGTKEITYTIKESDMNNLCYNGRQGFEYALKVALPDGMDYKISHTDREIKFTLIFEFDNFEEYYDMHKKIIGDDISISYGAGEKPTLLESFDYTAITTYLDTLFKDKGICNEKDFSWFAIYVGTVVEINDNVYECGDKVDIKDETIANIKYEEISIVVNRKKDDIVATVYASLSDDDHTEDQIGEFIYNLRKNEEITCTEEDGEYYIDFEIVGSSLDEVLKKTGSWLGMYIGVERSYEFIDMDSVAVVEKLSFIKEQVMLEDGDFEYESNLIGWHRGLSADNEEIEVEDYKLTADNLSNIEYKYIEDMKFENILITTDVSDSWGKYKRTITYQLPLNMIDGYNDKIIEQIKAKLGDGMVCEVYDDDKYRNYEVSIISADSEDIQTFTQTFLEAKNSFIVDEGIAFIGNDEITDVFKVNNDVLGMAGVKNVVVSFTSGNDKMKVQDSAGIQEKYVEFSFEYSGTTIQTMMILVIVLLAVAIIAVYVVILIRKIKSLKKKKMETQETEVIQ